MGLGTESSLHLSALSATQVENLGILARVWGFLKYHHPAVESGKLAWDDELFRILPAIVAAQNKALAQEALVHWIDALGPTPLCRRGRAAPSGDLDLMPEIAWIHDGSLLGPDLRNRLETLYASCPGAQTQYYVSLTPTVGNARFDHEPAYPDAVFPDTGFQLLALFRWWNIIQYWYPYRRVAGQDWSAVLTEFVPKVGLARDKEAYALALMELIAKANDTHANLWSSLKLRPPAGPCRMPVTVRFVEDQPTVVAVSDSGTNAGGSSEERSPRTDGSGLPAAGLQPGDILESLDGVPVAKLIADWTPLYADSNDAARQRDMGNGFTRGACGAAAVQVQRAGRSLSLTVARVEPGPGEKVSGFHDRPGDTFQLLSPDVAYLKLSTVRAADVAGYLERAKHTKGLIVDLRNYPSASMPFTLGPLLVSAATPFAAFTLPDLENPGAFRFSAGPVIAPGPFRYPGKVVLLVDEVTQSQAEYTAMALRAAPGALVVGSTTAGADGNVSEIPLPGGLRTMISGIGVFYPDHRPTQRVGIVPNVVARPTRAGIAAGRDEVLEAGIRQIVGR
ncbi:hypothetical protein DYQ86_08340 [Acidobacteria bacterium AB60]|nr:hypothetical protein DYQ86_08340 [Acidobacteria bacterium AB60]